MRPRRAALLVLAVVLVAPPVAPVAGNGAEPRPICPVCGDAQAETVDAEVQVSLRLGRTLDLSVDRSEVTIDVRADGTAEWTVQNRLADPAAARYLREHPERRTDMVAAVLHSDSPGRPAPDSVSDVRTSVDGQTLVVRFRHAGFAERRPGDVLFGDYFFVADDGFWFRLTVDELTVRPPDGYVFTTNPDGGAANRHAVAWTGGGNGPYITDVYLVMAPREGPAANLATRAALAGATLPFLVSDLLYALPGVALFGALVWAVGRRPSSTLADRLDRESVARALLVGGLAVAVHPLYAPVLTVIAGVNPPLLALGVVYVAAGGLALRPSALADRDAATARLLALPVSVVVLVGAGRYLVSPVGSEPVLAELGRQTLSVAPALPAGLLLAYGHAIERGGRPRRWAVGVAATLLVGALLWSNPFRPPGAFAGLVTLVLLVGAVLSVVAGYPLFLLGRLVAAAESADSPAPEADATTA